MRLRGEAVALLLVACVSRTSGGRPDTLYEEPPQPDYEVVDELSVKVCLYGAPDPDGGFDRVGLRTQDLAAQKLWAKADAVGADAVVAVKTEGGCTRRLPIDPLCNCIATATGTAVRWATAPARVPAPAFEPE